MIISILRSLKRSLIYLFTKLKICLIQDYRISLTEKYIINKVDIEEGYTKQISKQVITLINIINNTNVHNVLEIGFNAGHSAELFLQNTESAIISFDIGEHEYCELGKSYIDGMYPGRHTLIIGDSKFTLPDFILSNPDKKFDIIFIDGCHDYNTAKADLFNCKKLAHTNTVVIMDDTIYSDALRAKYNIGPTQVWLEAINNNIIEEISKVEFCKGRGMSWGKYVY